MKKAGRKMERGRKGGRRREGGSMEGIKEGEMTG